ncbi:phosphoenolpyruvate--protein phosphotransferase [Pedobacter sp. UC225_61]|uniref:phosphoenolpyruvate--protein phosphotransferase n=1 Tax=Pedobacter sp. UC225_61 TaxID=3374623 RepID=UPI0037A6E648
MINGIGVSPGISIGKAFVIKTAQNIANAITLSSEDEILVEISRFNSAIELAIHEIEQLKVDKTLALHKEDFEILETQIALISDPQIKEDVVKKIRAEKVTANDALLHVIEAVVQLFEKMDNDYMQARSADVKDIGNRIFKHLNKDKAALNTYKTNTIIIAEDLAPSHTITLDIAYITGFATQAGSKTSHTAIIAKSKGIPAVINCGEQLHKIKDNDVIILDGTKGILYVNPDENTLHKYQALKTEYQNQTEKLKLLKELKAVTTDGKKIVLSANIANAEDLESAFNSGAEGSGLFRTEMLFMDRDSFPDENEQFEFYKDVALNSKGKPIVIRTIDIGGDKHLPYFNLPVELNPFLGYRAIRICLDRKDLFIIQLKAILRASTLGDLKIMFPMVSNRKEIREAKMILEEAKSILREEKLPFNEHIKVGIMIEVPSAAVTADILAKEVDFFSIGTNDLCQYTLAVDRMNEKITHLYDPFNPAVLRLIRHVIEQARKYKIHVGMCGELASDPLATQLLMGMGLEEFSMSPASIPMVKKIILSSSMEQAKELCKYVMEMESSEDITTYLKQTL